jgi:hypothetical protein
MSKEYSKTEAESNTSSTVSSQIREFRANRLDTVAQSNIYSKQVFVSGTPGRVPDTRFSPAENQRNASGHNLTAMSEGHTKVSRNKEEFTIMSTVAYPTYRPQVIGSQIARPQGLRNQVVGAQVVRNQAARTRLVLTPRGRRVITFLIAVPLALAAFFAIVSAGQAAATNSAAVTDTSHTWITVESGETLWSLAYEIAPTKDPRDVIAEIVSLNQLNSDLQPGQRIALPTGY